MGLPYIGEIRLFAGNFAPVGWNFCEGQLVPISENETLYNLIGTTYGGDGQSTFALPDLRGRIPLHFGTSRSGTPSQIGETGGAESVSLGVQQIAAHSHPVQASSALATSTAAAGSIPASWPDAPYRKPDGATSPVALAPESVGGTGGSQPHENMPPYLGMNFIISLFGVYPSRT